VIGNVTIGHAVGKINVQDVNGNTQLERVHGNVRMEDVNGSVTISRSVHGDIHLPCPPNDQSTIFIYESDPSPGSRRTTTRSSFHGREEPSFLHTGGSSFISNSVIGNNCHGIVWGNVGSNVVISSSDGESGRRSRKGKLKRSRTQREVEGEETKEEEKEEGKGKEKEKESSFSVSGPRWHVVWVAKDGSQHTLY